MDATGSESSWQPLNSRLPSYQIRLQTSFTLPLPLPHRKQKSVSLQGWQVPSCMRPLHHTGQEVPRGNHKMRDIQNRTGRFAIVLGSAQQITAFLSHLHHGYACSAQGCGAAGGTVDVGAGQASWRLARHAGAISLRVMPGLPTVL